MANRQLKIWREDLRRYYDKTSLMMRVVIGAVLSFIFAYYTIKKVIKPQNAMNANLKKKLVSMEVIDDVDSKVTDLKNDTRKASKRLEGVKELNEKIRQECGSLSKAEIGESLLTLRTLIDKYQLRISSENKGTGMTSKVSRRRRTTQRRQELPVKISFPSNMDSTTQYFSVLGSYEQLRQFLMAIHGSKQAIFVDNIKINQSNELLTDANLNQYRALSCDFQVHIPYVNANASSSAKDGAKK